MTEQTTKAANPLAAKYLLNSIASTALDYTVFFVAVSILHIEAVTGTMTGSLVSAGLSYFLLRFWVFKSAAGDEPVWQLGKFIFGIVVATLLNMVFVALLHHFLGWSVWPSRIVSAIICWVIGFWFNAVIVFNSAPNGAIVAEEIPVKAESGAE